LALRYLFDCTFWTSSSHKVIVRCLFVLPSLYEGMPNTVMEAMAIGCPVIAGKIGGITELINKNQGLLIDDPADPSQIAKAMQQMTNRSLRKKYASKAKKRISQFKIDSMTAKYSALYEGLI